jgi:hypothetical protein
MSRMSKTKGKVGEREVANLLRDYGVEARRGYQYLGGSHDEPDVKHDIPGLHIEVKRKERLNINEAMGQAVADAGDKRPVVFHRSNRQPWLVTMNAQDFLYYVVGCKEYDRHSEKQAYLVGDGTDRNGQGGQAEAPRTEGAAASEEGRSRASVTRLDRAASEAV